MPSRGLFRSVGRLTRSDQQGSESELSNFWPSRTLSSREEDTVYSCVLIKQKLCHLFQTFQASLVLTSPFIATNNSNIMTCTTTSRHVHWVTMAASATIALIALLKDFDKLKDQEKQVKWAASGLSIALTMAGIAVFANMLLRDKFVGTLLEGGMVRKPQSSCNILSYVSLDTHVIFVTPSLNAALLRRPSLPWAFWPLLFLPLWNLEPTLLQECLVTSSIPTCTSSAGEHLSWPSLSFWAS